MCLPISRTPLGLGQAGAAQTRRGAARRGEGEGRRDAGRGRERGRESQRKSLFRPAVVDLFLLEGGARAR